MGWCKSAVSLLATYGILAFFVMINSSHGAETYKPDIKRPHIPNDKTSFRRNARSTGRNMERHFAQQMTAGMSHVQAQQQHQVDFSQGHFVNVDGNIPSTMGMNHQGGALRDDRQLHPSQFEALTPFSCEGKMPGYYADLRASCQVYHVCKLNGLQESYHCPNGTIFGGSVLICNWWYKTACGFDGPLYPEGFISNQPNIVLAESDAARLHASRLHQFDTSSMTFTPEGPAGNLHQVQYPEFIAIAPPFDLSPRPHLEMGGNGDVNAEKAVPVQAAPQRPESANLMASNPGQHAQLNHHPQETFMIQNHQNNIQQHQSPMNHQNLQQHNFMQQPSQAEPVFTLQQQNQQRIKTTQPEQQFVVNSGTGFRSHKTRREGGNEPQQLAAEPNANDYQYISMDEMREMQKPRKFKTATSSPVTVDSPNTQADDQNNRKLTLKLKRANETQPAGKKNLSFDWSGFEHPPPYDPIVGPTSATSGAQKLPQTVPFTELEISGKIRIPVSPERLFRAVPLFREFHYKESEVGDTAMVSGVQDDQQKMSDDRQEPEAEANNEINIADKSGAVRQRFVNGGRFNLIGPDVNILAGQEEAASTILQETVIGGQHDLQLEQERQQLRQVSAPQALVANPPPPGHNSTTPAPMMVKTTIVTSVSSSQSSVEPISPNTAVENPAQQAVEKPLPFERKVRIQGSDGFKAISTGGNHAGGIPGTS